MEALDQEKQIHYLIQPDIDEIYLYAKDLHEAKYQFLINKRESTDIKNFNDFKAFIEYLNDMNDIYKKN